ncbi:MAG: hypothetical protein Q4B85_02415, partial [Lachnospiraceae bacterium]|nr:hypothetical protein [Lachnospiraceae bacterium]
VPAPAALNCLLPQTEQLIYGRSLWKKSSSPAPKEEFAVPAPAALNCLLPQTEQLIYGRSL